MVLLVVRTDFETTIVRTPGMLYQERESGEITNLYQLSMVNKTNDDVDVRLELIEPAGSLEMIGSTISMKSQGKREGAFFVIIPPENLEGMSQKIKIGVFSGDEQIETVKTKFLGPAR